MKPAENIIRLNTVRCSKKIFEGYYFLEIMAGDPDNIALDEAFRVVILDVVFAISENHVVQYGASYEKIKPERKKWFSQGWSTPEYSQDGDTTRLKQHLVDIGWKDGLFADIVLVNEHTFFGVKCPDEHKELCLVQERLDFELFQKTCMCQETENTYRTAIDIFPEAVIQHHATAYETVRAYRESTNDMVFIFINDVAPNGHVAINKRYMTQDEFIEILKPIVEKHNKTLEVNL